VRIRVLGSAGGGGFPQWNCGCPNCAGVRAGRLAATRRTQESIAVSGDGEHWFLINATPDIRAQQALAVDTKSPLAARKPAKARVERKAKAPIQKDARDKRPAAHSRAAGSGTPKPSIETARPSPEGASAAVTPQPFTRPTTVAPPVQIEQPPAGPAARATAGVPAAAPAAPTVVSRSDEQRILGVLGDYRAAYEQLNPQAVETVWPSVDTRALARAFNGLSSQSIGFDRCNVSVAAATARAACQGDVEYVKRVGGRTQSARREWVFDLQKSEDGAWRIKSLTAR